MTDNTPHPNIAAALEVTHALNALDAKRLELSVERDRLIVESGIGPRPLAAALGISVQRAMRILTRARERFPQSDAV